MPEVHTDRIDRFNILRVRASDRLRFKRIQRLTRVIQTSQIVLRLSDYNSKQLDTHGVYGYQGNYYSDRYSNVFCVQKSVRLVSNVVLLPCRTHLIELNSTLARQ